MFGVRGDLVAPHDGQAPRKYFFFLKKETKNFYSASRPNPPLPLP
jgi:hypothetical protein